VNEIEAVADNDERQLICELGLLEEVLDLLGVVVVGFPADALDFADLACASCGLDVLEVYLRILAKVDNGAKIVVQT
jgi:hypothetical protein